MGPLINRDDVYKEKIWCRVGKKLRLQNVRVDGEPPAKVSWYFKDVDQATLPDVQIDNPDYETSIVISNARRNQTGKYLIKAINEHGEDECEVEFTVLGPPGPPEGPMEISDVHKEGCKIKWLPPLDDGGSPITDFVVEKYDLETGKWTPCGITDGPVCELDAKGLQTGKKYRFRVRARNEEGDSEPLEGPEDATLIKDPFDPPGPPGLPEITDWTSTTVKLKWKPPLRDNGAPVESYTIEYKEPGSDEWIVGPKVKAKKFPDGEVTGLTPGKKYEFRVRAENKAGLGEPSESTNPHFMKERFAPPKIDRTNLDTKTVKVNQQVVIDVDVSGEPAPETTWFFNGEEITNSETIKTAHSPHHTKLMLIPAKRSMMGKYTIKAKNSSGEDEAEVEIIIRGKPGPPEGPLEITDITKNKCHLKWKPPLDDGGSPIEYYEIEKYDVATDQWLPAGTSPTCEADVKGLTEGKKYKFRVRAVNKDGESPDLEGDEIIEAKNPFEPPSKPDKPIPMDWGPDFCDLKWKPPKDDGGSPITGYIIEMRDKDKRQWKEVLKTEEKTLNGRIEVPHIEEGHEYEFRVIAVNKAGPSEPSDPSETIKAENRFQKPRIDRSTLHKRVMYIDQLLRVDADYTGAPEPTITWYNPNGDVMTTDDRFTVESEDFHTHMYVRKVKRSDTGIYKIRAKNDQGEDVAEVEILVVTVPSAPIGPLEVDGVTFDSCHLTWKPPKDDGGDPVKYYTVEKMDPDRGIWVPCGETLGKTTEMDVEGLNEGTRYYFRVRAVNNQGESEPLETDETTLIKNPFDPPGPPENVKLVDWDKRWVKLKWEKPKDDGGARITHYIIEKLEAEFSSKWLKACTTETDDCNYKVTDLTENSKYKFRVKAVNKAGPGPPSEPSEEVTCKTRNAPPIIDRTNLGFLRVRIGEAIKFDVKVSGEPPADKVWELNKTVLKDSTSLSITNEDYKTRFHITTAKRSDSGTYIIKASNKNGRDEAEKDILVVGPPEKPQGPMKFDEIFADRCRVEWKVPRDDGGSPITHYILEKMDLSTNTWLPCGKSMDLQCNVVGLEENHEYQFRAKAVNAEGESEYLEGLDTVIAKNPFSPPGPPGKPTPKDYDFDRFDLKWDEPKHDGGSKITGYIIEMRSANDDIWTKATEVKDKLEFGTVKNLEVGETYVFRVRAVNAAGPGKPGPESDNLKCKYKKLKPKINRRSLREITVKVGEVIEFDVDVQGEPDPDITWTKDGRSLSDSATRRITNKPYKTHFYVDEAVRKDEGTYLITAVNIHGKDMAEVRVYVLDRPGPPQDFEVSGIYKNGCQLNWNPPKDDGGSPIESYTVEKLDIDTNIWSPVGSTHNCHIDVTTLEQGKEYKFRVRAVNANGESDNVETRPIVAKDPFGVPLPPSAPDIVDWSENHMDLEWKEPIDDGGSPITGYIIEKRSRNNMEWVKCGQIEGNRCKGTAKNLTEGEEYQFRIIALNKAGPSDPGQPSQWKEAKARNLPPRIDRKNLRDITVSEGEMLKFDANIIGEPAPEVTWKKEEKEIDSTRDRSLMITNVPYNTKLIIKSCKRSDAGQYTVLAKNEHGKDQVIVNLTVIGPPGPPQGPLKSEDVTSDGCTLKWRRPKDDGGSPIEYYQVEKLDPDTGLWMPCGRTADTNLAVKGLIPKKKYKFRVSAVNAEGESEPLVGDETIEPKEPFGEPGAPCNLKLVDYDADSADLKWEPPTDTGGAEITGYLVEKKDEFGKWVRAHEVPGTQTKCTVPNLITGETYKFRVKAITAGGISAPSNEVGPVLIKARNLPPRIDRTNLIEVRCKAGDSFNFDVNISGEPPPDKKWLSNDKEITSSDRIKIVFKDYNTKIYIRNATRKENGTLTIHAENVNGRDTADVKITVIDVPGAPMGPLNVKEMTADDCILEWKPPRDNGGMPVTHYVVEKCDETMGGRWLPAGETDGPETNFKVDGLTQGHKYKFRVRAVNKEGKSEPLETSGSYEAKNPFEKPTKPGRPEVTDFDSGWADLKWEKPEFDGGSKISGYIIDKWDDLNNKWEPCARTEGDEPKGRVKGLVDGVKYKFRVRAVNKAGESDASEPSGLHLSRPKNVAPKIDRHAMMDITIMAGEPLNIKVPVEGEPSPTMTWTKNGETLDDGIRVNLRKESNRTTIRISESKRSDAGVYELTAKNLNGTDRCTVTVKVLDVPAPPEGPVQTSNVTKESMTVSWKPPKDDGGSEIKHYIVEKQDQETMRWVKCGETKQLKLNVDGLIEGHDYKFRIRAVNNQGESGPLIGPTEPITAKDPFTVPSRPGKPWADDWDVDHVDLKWEPPKTDGGSKIKKWIIEKKTKFGIWEKAAEAPGPHPRGTVTGLTEGTEYMFRIIAVNEAGESEPSEPSDTITAEARYVKPWIDLSAMQDLVVCAGQTIKFDVPIRGAPTPTIKWGINNKTVTTSEHIDIFSTRTITTLEIAFSKRSDSGQYTLEVSNELGTARARANVKVVDRPAPPEAPLRLSDVTSSSCHLAWGPSPDDGGSPITHYLIEKMDVSRGSWVEAGITTDLKTTIYGLINNKEYLMRVKAVNAVGESDPTPLDKSFRAKSDSDVPDPPGKPEAIDWDINHVDLDWARPISDGGARIEGYIIQRKQKGSSQWIETTTINGDINKGRASHLIENEYYQFRIVAFNANGQSLPGEPSGYIQARARNLPPKILTPLKKVNVKAGNNYTLDVEYIGSPDPTVTWFIEGKPLVTNERITMSAIAPITTFHMVNCKRTDAGEITIKLVNDSGSDKGSFLFNVLDVPGPPEGPLGYDSITGSSVQLTWKPPKDNGGSELTSYIIEKKDMHHGGGWVPAVNYVDPHCLVATVPRLMEGTEYQFRVFAVNAQGRGLPLVGDPVTPRADEDVPGKPGRPTALDADYTFIKVTWRPPASNGGSPITGYDVERRDLLGGGWVRVTTRPIGRTEYHDTDVEANRQYEYKVRAHNKVGPGPHSDPSIPITAKPMKAPPKLNLDVLNRRVRVRAGERIHVEIPFEGAPTPTVEWTKEGKRVVTNRFNSDVFSDLILFEIDNSNRLDSGKYKVTAQNEFGSDSGYLHVTVVDRPDPPVGPVVYTNIDRDTIKLQWNVPEDDGGCDITGYTIEKTEYGSNDWISCPGYATNCAYTARGLVEGRKYRFRIRAENAIGVSDALEGKHIEARSPYDPPGPPGQPQVTAYTPSTASIKWTPPTETGGREIIGYYIEKREIGSDWTRVNNYPCPTLHYTVPGLRDGGRYEFRVIAVNEAGPGQPSKPSDPITAGKQKFRPDPPEGLLPDRVTKSEVFLSWRPPRNDGGSKIIGYIIEQRHKSEKEFRELNTIPHPHLSYTCTRLTEHEEYCFRVSAVNEVGRSEPCKATDFVTIGEQANRPKIDLSCVKDIRVRAGDDFSVNINYVGFPKPTAEFKKDDILLSNDSRVHIQVTEEFVSIIVTSSVREDAGQYRLRLTNDAGYDTATFRVTVLDRPDKPRNIYASDFAGEALTLNWSAPLEDGGSPITNYIIEKSERGSGLWQKVSSYCTSTHVRVRNLKVNTDYDFRVYAENHYGVSEPGQNEDIIKAKHPFDPPGPPSKPVELSTTTDSITIQWNPPRNDGGSAVTGYVVEKRKTAQNWSHACHSTITDLTLRVSGLEENEEYEFRVAAVNIVGQGNWSPASDPIRCGASKCAPKITSDITLRDIVVIAGNDLSVTVPFIATPQPTAKWSIDGQPVVGDERISTQINQHEAYFYNKKAKRSDTGMYNIQLTNSEGSDQAACKVLVVDRPSRPNKPVEAYDITPETCTLSWRPPTDDGGSPITNYVVEKFDVAGGYWTKISSFVRGTTYEVLGLEPNKKYNFRVRAENQYGLSDGTEMDEPITAKFPFRVPDSPGKPKVSQESTTALNLVWDRPSSDGGSKIQGYKIEYREVTEEHWVLCTTSLVRSQTFTMNNLVTGCEYEFRVKATNAAGDSRPSMPSQQFHLKGKGNPPGPPGSPIVTRVGKSYVDLKWSPPAYDGGARILGYIIEKKEVGSSVWDRVNDYNLPDVEYTVSDLTEGREYQFRIRAVNSTGQSDPCPATNPVRVGDLDDGESPDFIRFLHNTGAGLGKTVKLECEASGRPAPKAKWMKNGREITEHPGRVIMEENNGVFTLTITELWEIDEGEYTCQAYNHHGYSNTNCRLKVGAPPKIEYLPSELHYPEGDNSKIKVKWSGDLPFNVEVFRNGKLITESSQFKMSIFDEFLIIFMREISLDFAGQYTIKVSNESGSAEGSFNMYVSGLPGAPIGPLEVSEISSHTCNLSWNVPEHDGGSKITNYIVERRDFQSQQWITISSFCKTTSFSVQGLTENQEYYFRVLAANANGHGPPLVGINPVRAKPPYDVPGPPGTPNVLSVGGDFVNLSWEKPEHDGGSKIKGYWIEKREAGYNLWQRVNTYIQSTTQINITNLIEGRQYEFRVMAENEAGLSLPSSNSSSVVVKDPEEPQPPEIIQPLKNLNCVENKSARFATRITGYPKPKVTWLKGARELFDSAKHEIIVTGNLYELVVKGVYGEDEDTYTARAVNNGGTKSTKADLKIKTAPKLSVPPRFRGSAFFDKGENGVIKIPFTGNPKPTITWTKDGERIESGARYQVKTEERHAILTIMDVSKADSGSYTITAENELGQDFALIPVQVSDRPDPPRFPICGQIGADSLVVEWQPPAWDGGSAITNYIVEKQELPMTAWTRCGHTRFNLFPVTDLTPGHEYRFRIFAQNVHGQSNASEESGIVTTLGAVQKKQPKTKYESKFWLGRQSRRRLFSNTFSRFS